MASFIARRLIHGLMAVLVLSLLVFILIRSSGDPVTVMFQAGTPSDEEVRELRAHLGLDKPYPVQYLLFLKQLARGDLGKSFHSNLSVSGMIADRIGPTIILTLASAVAAFCIALPVGILSALKRGSFIDLFGRVFAIFGISFPNFWLGIVFMLFFAVHLRWLPPSGFEGPEYVILPALTLGLILSSILARLIRSSMLDAMRQPYVVTARSKGIREWRVVVLHGLRNALIPTVTFFGLQFGYLLGGTVIIEQVFSWPGVGRMLVEAIGQRDFPVVQGTVLFLAVAMVTVNFCVDLTYGFLDPRIRVGKR